MKQAIVAVLLLFLVGILLYHLCRPERDWKLVTIVIGGIIPAVISLWRGDEGIADYLRGPSRVVTPSLATDDDPANLGRWAYLILAVVVIGAAAGVIIAIQML